jgi:large subunit ribosomal protein L4
LSARNLQRTEVMRANDINAYKILNADVLVVTEKSLETIDGILIK